MILRLASFGIIAITFSLSSCISGKYIAEPTGKNVVTKAPMKLKLIPTAEWTYYTPNYTMSYSYTENARYKKKGDTLYMRERTYFGDSTELSKEFTPRFVVGDDSLYSIEYDFIYVKKKAGK